MSRVNLENSELYNCKIKAGLKYDTVTIAPVTPYTFDDDLPPVIFTNQGAAANVNMPVSDASQKGLSFTIINQGTGALTLLQAVSLGGGAFTPALSAAAGATTRIICTGLSGANGWRVM